MEPFEPTIVSDDRVEPVGRIDDLEAELARYRNDEELLVQTLLNATRFATELRESAEAEGELIVRRATAEAEAKLGALAFERHEAEVELGRLRELTEELRKGLSHLLSTLLGDLRVESGEQIETDDAAATQDGATNHEGALEDVLEERIYRAIEPVAGPAIVANVDEEVATLSDQFTEPE